MSKYWHVHVEDWQQCTVSDYDIELQIHLQTFYTSYIDCAYSYRQCWFEPDSIMTTHAVIWKNDYYTQTK